VDFRARMAAGENQDNQHNQDEVHGGQISIRSSVSWTSWETDGAPRKAACTQACRENGERYACIAWLSLTIS
jgi:hypothetical protein